MFYELLLAMILVHITKSRAHIEYKLGEQLNPEHQSLLKLHN